MKQVLNHLFDYKTLTRTEAKEILTNIAAGKYNENQIAAFMSVYVMRNITIEEFMGFRDALLELCIRVDLSDYQTIDLCGTGGDGKDTFNISTLASFVVAGTGIKVAKHGNVGVSSTCGSSNLMEYFGYKFTNDSQVLKQQIETAGVCFMHAPLFHPAMKNVAPVRRSLGVKTFFNMLGPVINPAFPTHQVSGVFNLTVARLYKYLFENTDKEFIVLHSFDGYDEISLTSDLKYYSNHKELIIRPEEFGFKPLRQEELSGGGSIEESAKIFKNILEGNGTEAQNHVVLANAAVGIQCTNQSLSLMDCVAQAKESLENGKALQAFKKLIAQ